MKLSVKKVERLNEPGRYGDGRGLYLQVRLKQFRRVATRFEKTARN